MISFIKDRQAMKDRPQMIYKPAMTETAVSVGRRAAALKMTKRFAAALLIAAIAALAALPAAYADAPKLDAKAYVLADADTGEILFEKNSTQILVPASMTKLMTLYLTLESIAENRIAWTDEVTISEYSNKISRQPSLSSFQLAAGARYSVRDLFYAAALNSSNASAIALSEHIGGGREGAFVAMMNAKARAFGLTDAVFVNSSGLNNSDLFGLHPEGTGAREDSRLSARSMACIAFRLVNDYPEFLSYSSVPKMTIREGTPEQLIVNSTNRMLAGGVYTVEGVKGLKTGYTFNAGYCFAGYAERKSGRFITVVMGAPTSEERFRGSGRLLNFGFGVAEGRESRAAGQAHAWLYPDGLNYYDRAKNGVNSLLTLGDTGFGVTENGRADIVALNGNLYSVTKRGYVSRLNSANGVGAAAVTFFSRDGETEIAGAASLAELEKALLQTVEDTAEYSYCFKIEGAVNPRVISTVSGGGAEYKSYGGSGGGTVIGFWNHASENDILWHGFTFYYLDANRKAGGMLVEASFGELKVRIDRIEPMDAVFTRGESIPVTVR